MIPRALRELWRYSALPVLALLLGILALGAWLQARALRVQGAPLLVTVSAETEGAETRAVAQAPEATAPLGPTLALEAANPAGSAADRARAAFESGLEKQRGGDRAGAAAAYREALRLRPVFWEAAFNLATVLAASGRTDEAITVLTAAVRLGGGERRARTLVALAVAYAEVGRLPEAERAYEESINLAPADPRARLGLAKLYYEKLARTSDAERVYREVLRLNDQNAAAWLGLAKARLDQGEPQEAERILERVVALDPGSEDGRVALAAVLADRGETDRAREHLVWLVEHVPAPVEALFRLGRLDYAQRQYRLAAEEYGRAIRASGGTHVASFNNLGLSLKALGDLAGAKRSFLEAARLAPDSTSAHYNLGLLALEEEDLPAARVRFERAVAIDPRYSDAWYNLGVVHGMREAPRAAIAAYQAALALDPGDSRARLNLAVQFRRAGEREQAVQQYRILLAARPAYAAAWFNLALVLRELKQPREAEEAYRAAIRLEPEEKKHRSGLGLLYADLGRSADAARIFQEVLEIDPRDASTRFNLAIQQRRLGRTDLAVEEARRAVTLEPGFEKAWLLLGELLAQADDHQGAIDAFGKALAVDPGDALTRYELGKQQHLVGQYVSAAASYRESLKSQQDNAWIWYHLGKALQALGQETGAQAAYQSALKLDPSMARFVYRRVGEPADAVSMAREQLAANPDSAALRLALAEQLQRAGSGAEAIREVQQVLQKNSADSAAWKTLAGIYLEQDEAAAAEEALSKARVLLPGDAEVAFQLGRVLARREKIAQAVPHLVFAVDHAADPLAALRLLGNVQYELRDYSAAVVTLARAAALEPDDGPTLVDLGKAYYRRSQHGKALEHFAEARRLMPEYPWSAIWLGRAYAGLRDWSRAEAAFRDALAKDPRFLQGWFSLGDLSEKRGDAVAAREYYNRVLQIDPLHQDARDRLAALK